MLAHIIIFTAGNCPRCIPCPSKPIRLTPVGPFSLRTFFLPIHRVLYHRKPLDHISSYLTNGPTQNPDALLADLASMLLSNLTASSTACSALLTLKIPAILDPTSPTPIHPAPSRCGTCADPVPYPSGEESEQLALPLLIDAFVEGAAGADPAVRKRKGELHFLSSVFANMSVVCTPYHHNSYYLFLIKVFLQTPSGRSFFLTPRPVNILHPDADYEYPLSKIVSFTEHKDTIRRGGVASTLK